MKRFLPLALTALLCSPAFAADDKSEAGPPAETPSGAQPAVPGGRPAILGDKAERIKERQARKEARAARQEERAKRHQERKELREKRHAAKAEGKGGGKDHPKAEDHGHKQ